MSLIVAGRFDTFAHAQLCARALFTAGFSTEDVSLFYVTPPGMHDATEIGGDRPIDPELRVAHRGAGAGGALFALAGAIVGLVVALVAHVSIYLAVLAGAVGCYGGVLAGAMATARHSRRPRAQPHKLPVRHSGVLLAVHVERESEERAAAILKTQGAMDVERAQGRWQDGQWSDFDPVSPPVLAEKVSSYNPQTSPRA